MFDGDNLLQLRNEAGGHRIQRIPPTEKRGRVHTSTVTVAVIEDGGFKSTSVPESELKIEWYSGSGAGGQHRNKHQNSCRITHIPTGIVATSQTRERRSSYQNALQEINSRVDAQLVSKYNKNVAMMKRDQRGSGMRGDKIRTYRFQDDKVIDHQTNKTSKCSVVMNGGFHLLY